MSQREKVLTELATQITDTSHYLAYVDAPDRVLSNQIAIMRALEVIVDNAQDDLLEACKACLALLDANADLEHDDTSHEIALSPAREMARAAIAKAEGTEWRLES